MTWGNRDRYSNFDWSDEKVAELTRHWSAGHSASQIAKLINCPTRNAVIGKIHRLGLTRTVALVRECRRSAGAGQRAKQIAKDRKPKLLPNQVHPNHKPDKRPMRCDPVVSRSVQMLDLEAQDCRYATGEDERGHLFCGRPKLDASYCAGHMQIAYSPANDKRRAPLKALERMIKRAA